MVQKEGSALSSFPPIISPLRTSFLTNWTANNWKANSGSWYPVCSLRRATQSNNNMTAVAQKGSALLGRKSASITGYESVPRSKKLPHTPQLQEYVNPNAKNSCVIMKGVWQTTETTLQYMNEKKGSVLPRFVDLPTRQNEAGGLWPLQETILSDVTSIMKEQCCNMKKSVCFKKVLVWEV